MLEVVSLSAAVDIAIMVKDQEWNGRFPYFGNECHMSLIPYIRSTISYTHSIYWFRISISYTYSLSYICSLYLFLIFVPYISVSHNRSVYLLHIYLFHTFIPYICSVYPFQLCNRHLFCPFQLHIGVGCLGTYSRSHVTAQSVATSRVHSQPITTTLLQQAFGHRRLGTSPSW